MVLYYKVCGGGCATKYVVIRDGGFDFFFVKRNRKTNCVDFEFAVCNCDARLIYLYYQRINGSFDNLVIARGENGFLESGVVLNSDEHSERSCEFDDSIV